MILVSDFAFTVVWKICVNTHLLYHPYLESKKCVNEQKYHNSDLSYHSDDLLRHVVNFVICMYKKGDFLGVIQKIFRKMHEIFICSVHII